MKATNPQEQEMAKREIESTEGAMDKLVSPAGTVYELYELMEDEIKIVEG